MRDKPRPPGVSPIAINAAPEMDAAAPQMDAVLYWWCCIRKTSRVVPPSEVIK